MRWKGRRQSSNIDDRRGRGAGVVGGGAGLILVLIVAALFGADPAELLGQAAQITQSSGEPDPAEAPLREFVAVTLADTEEVWNRVLPDAAGKPYREPTLVLFSGQVSSACGMAGSAVGPFYCSDDEQVYLDLEFFETLKGRLGATGDFAQAYVIAHEVGHHLQKILGTLEAVHAKRSRMSERDANALSVRLELQADFLAGVWAHHARSMAGLDESDVREAIEAAEAIGDDRLQKQAKGTVVPDAFTHGTSAQRVRWFLKGFKRGDLRDGDTFSANPL